MDEHPTSLLEYASSEAGGRTGGRGVAACDSRYASRLYASSAIELSEATTDPPAHKQAPLRARARAPRSGRGVVTESTISLH